MNEEKRDPWLELIEEEEKWKARKEKRLFHEVGKRWRDEIKNAPPAPQKNVHLAPLRENKMEPVPVEKVTDLLEISAYLRRLRD